MGLFTSLRHLKVDIHGKVEIFEMDKKTIAGDILYQLKERGLSKDGYELFDNIDRSLIH